MIRMHILVMEFVGSLGVPAPKLREADLDLQGWHTCFNECFHLLRALFHRKQINPRSLCTQLCNSDTILRDVEESNLVSDGNWLVRSNNESVLKMYGHSQAVALCTGT
jgi:hypothetical protein